MATVLPPASKRQRTALADKAREQQDVPSIPANLGSIRVQFVDQATGKPTGGAVSIPVVDATVNNLELLLNSLQGNDASERVPYRFLFLKEVVKDGESNILDISTDIYQSLLLPGLKSTEESISLQYIPQAVFRVRAVSRCSSSIPGHGEAILATQFSPESSSRIVSGSGDNTARIWDCDTGTPLHTLKGHTSWVLVVSWSPEATVIATGSMDNTVILWDPLTGSALGNPLKGHTKWVRSIAWEPYHLQAPGRPRLASASKDATVRIWDVTTKRIETVLSGHKGSVSCVKWGGTGKLYTSSQDKTIKIWDASTGSLLTTLTLHAHWVNHLALSTDFALRTAFHDHTGNIPSTSAGKLEKAKSRYETAATQAGQITEHLVSASDDFTIYLWNPSSSTPQKPTARLLGHAKPVTHVCFSPSGLLIASSSFDNHIKLWSGLTGAFLYSLRGHVGPVYMSCFSADSRLLVSGSADTTCKVWDVGGTGQGKLKENLIGHKDEVFAVDWSGDGGLVGSGGKDKQVRLWRH
ncbi:MAG: hypothetical protein MMC33_006495 [Icmadophila ericetorum]|nr:hypothetical protein [Icmadophila ericetorum]